MCEQTEVQYLPDEVVWVKLHQPSLWWPGQVQDYEKLPEDVTEGLRKKPIAIVKFFQEDAYEYVSNLNNIYHYNCSRKHEFIKKGLALARSKRPERPAHMDLFPQDVATAETLTHGNPDIIRDDEFAPEEKPSYDGLFGTEKKKNLKKAKSVVESILKERPSWRVKPLMSKPSGTPRTPSSPKPSSPKVITHPRFINKALRGETDYRICIREQPHVEDETRSPSSEYRCHTCDFVTSRLNVIVLHYRSHSKSTTPIPNRTKVPRPKSAKTTVTKSTVAKPKSETPTKSTPTEPPKKRNFLKEVSPEPVEKTEVTSPKKSPKTQTPKTQALKRKAKAEIKPEVEGKKAKKEEIQELLKDWSDEEMEEESQIVGRTSDDEGSRNGDADFRMDVDNPSEKPDEDGKDEEPVAVEEKKDDEKKAPPAKSKAVFDFDDDDEGLDPKLTQSTRVFGRKIPRVIENTKERRTSFPDADSPEPDDTKERKAAESTEEKESGVGEPDEEKEPAVAEEAPEKEDDEKQEELASKQADRMKELESMNAEIDSLLEKTALPDLPEIPKLNAFSMDVTDDGQVPVEKSKEEEMKDKSILREHNNISPNAVKENVEDESQVEETSKNSLPEVGSAVEEISTPPQADSVKITAETIVSKPETVKNAVITSVVLSSPQSTSGGDHSYVSEKHPPISQMPPLVPTSPKSPPGKSRTYILSRSSPGKSPTSRTPEDAGIVKVVGMSPAATKTNKPMPSLVKKDGKYVIMQTTQSGDVKVMPSLTPTSANPTKVNTQSQMGKKLVILTKQPSRNVVVSSQKQANILSKTPLKRSVPTKVTSSSSTVGNPPVSAVQSPQRKAVETKTVTNIMPPKKNILLTSTGGLHDAKTYLMPVSSVNTKSPAVFTTRSPAGSKSVVLPQTVKLVSSKDVPGKVVLQMDSQKTKVQLPTMKRAVPAVRDSNKEKSLSSGSLKMTAVLSSPKSLTTATSPKTLSAVSSPKPLSPITPPKTLAAASSPRTLTTLTSPKTPIAVTSTKTLASPIVAKTPPKQTTNKFFHRDASSTLQTRVIANKQTIPIKKTAVPSKQSVRGNASPAQTKPSILQTTPRAVKLAAPKTSKESEAKQEAVVTSAPVQDPVIPEGLASGSIVAAEGSDGAAIMYILDNGTLISYDQVNQADSQARTVFIDPATLSSSSGDLGNLIFAFDESAGNQGTLLSIAPPEGTQPTEFAFAPSSERPAGSTTQDILAEALANTQVLQAEASASEMILDSSSIASNTTPSSSALYPNNVLTLSNNVLETSLTLNAPIMTPLEVPSAVSSLQPPPVASGTLEIPMTIAQPDITISTSSYASLPIPSATIQGTVFSDSTTATYSTMVPLLSGDADKQTFFVETAEGTTFELAEGDASVFACADQTEAESLVESVTCGETGNA